MSSFDLSQDNRSIEQSNQNVQSDNSSDDDVSIIALPSEHLPEISEEELLTEELVTADIAAYEKMMDSFFGCKLSSLMLGECANPEIIAVCKIFVSRYSNRGFGVEHIERLTKEIVGDIEEPSAMLFKNTKEMSESIFKMYQISYAHYILGKYNNMRCMFPYRCCGNSSENLVFSLWDAGIISAVSVGTRTYDHSYIIVPFAIQGKNLRGVIVIDPTSDQLKNYEPDKVRNLIMVTTKEKWSYVTDWRHGGDLYPEIVHISACYGWSEKPYKAYLRQALENLVIIT